MNATDKAEALRLLDEMGDAALAMNPPPPLWARHSDARKALRSLLSAQGEAEPSAVGMLPDDLLRLIGAYGAAATYQSDVYRLHHYEQLILGIKSYVEQRARELARKGVGNG